MVVIWCKYCEEFINVFKPSDWKTVDEHMAKHEEELRKGGEP